MPREVNNTQPYVDKFIKLVPTEIIGAYIAVDGVIKIVPDETAKKALTVVAAVVLLGLTPLYLIKFSKVKNVIQIVISSLSFVVWVYSLGGPFEVIGIYNAAVAGVILILWTLIIPLAVQPQQTT